VGWLGIVRGFGVFRLVDVTATLQDVAAPASSIPT
jgi:hypothetical protein